MEEEDSNSVAESLSSNSSELSQEKLAKQKDAYVYDDFVVPDE